MPRTWEEFTPAELAPALGESRPAAEGVLDLALDLDVKLPRTKAAFLSGIVSRAKAAIIARAVGAMDPGEARAAEALVIDRAGRLTPGGLRAAINRAVMEVAPGKATKRREQAARLARVERWSEDSGNAALAGRELPPAAVLAADQRVTAWAKELKRAGLDGDMDQLRALAYLDILLGTDSRPRPDDTAAGPGRRPAGRADRPDAPRTDATGTEGPGGPGGWSPAGGPLAGAVPPGFAGKANLTIPVTTAHPARRPARRAGRHRAHRPRPGPRPGRRGRPQPPHYLVPHRHRPGRARHRARLRPPRTRTHHEPQESRADGRRTRQTRPGGRP